MRSRWLAGASVAAMICGAGAQAAFLAGPAAAGTARATGTARQAGTARAAVPTVGPVPAGFRPQSATFVSADEGWVLGTAPCVRRPCTSVVRTLNGGRTWRGIPAPVTPLSHFGQGPGVGKLRFASPRDGFAYDPALYVTHDGGSRWHRVRMPGAVVDLEAAAGVVYADVSARGRDTIYSTPAGRDRWSRVSGLPARVTGRAAQDTITLHGGAAWIFLGGRLFATKTGARWVRERIPCRRFFAATSLASFDSSHISLECVGDAGLGSTTKAIYVSSNGGARFTRAGFAPRGGDGGILAQPSPARIFLASASAAAWIYASRTHGRTWYTAKFLDNGGIPWTDFGFTTSSQGVAVSGPAGLTSSRMFMTRNGGRTWLRVRF